ncbi:hypothetical protein H2203_008852 [Taxawa tesnikishii (nom. ined.)]|nr:hypothetical protein H2203_008852 [Dothideales sp. JES 119]
MTDQTLILVTGANRGLGYYAAQQMAATGGYHVLLGARSLSKAEDAIKELSSDSSVKLDTKYISPIEIDVTSDSSILQAVKTVEQKYGRLDVLLNNAGIAHAQSGKVEDGSLRKAYQAHYDTNVFGAAATTEAFLPLLRKGKNKRLAFTSSGLSSLKWASEMEGPASGENYPIYRSTKSALDMIVVHYARSLEKEGFVVSSADPGYCATNLNDFQGFKDPREGAKVLIRVCEAGKEEVHCARVDETSKEPW